MTCPLSSHHLLINQILENDIAKPKMPDLYFTIFAKRDLLTLFTQRNLLNSFLGSVLPALLLCLMLFALLLLLGRVTYFANIAGSLGILFLGLILWTVVEKFWGKPTNRTDRLDIFPLLNKDVLQRWGKKWGEHYEYLNKVVLYDAPLKYPIDVKYVLYFEFDTSTPKGKRCEMQLFR